MSHFPLPEAVHLSCRIAYVGGGVLEVHRLPHGADGAHFETLWVERERRNRVVPEYVPGFAGLSFDIEQWHAFQHGKPDMVQFKHPHWTCDEYEKFRSYHPHRT